MSKSPSFYNFLLFFLMQVNEFAGDDVLRDFVKEREANGDFVAKLCDGIFLKNVIESSNNRENFEDISDVSISDAMQTLEEVYYCPCRPLHC